MADVERLRDLRKDLPDKLLVEQPLFCDFLLDERGQVAARAMLHDDVDAAALAVDHAVVVSHDVLVNQVAENVHLCDQLLLFLLPHLAVTKLFPDQSLPVSQSSHATHLAERALADHLQLLVRAQTRLGGGCGGGCCGICGGGGGSGGCGGRGRGEERGGVAHCGRALRKRGTGGGGSGGAKSPRCCCSSSRRRRGSAR